IAANGFRHAETDAGLHWLRYQHRLRLPTGSVSEPELITDFMGYNFYEWKNLTTGQVEMPADVPNWVGDLALEGDAAIQQAQGQFVLQLSKGSDRFEAVWDLDKGTCTLMRLSYDAKPLADGNEELKLREEKQLSQVSSALKTGSSYQLRFANVDDRLTVW